MKAQTKTMIAALGALMFTAAPAVANAERVFFLVGTRHIYKVGTYEYAHVEERQKIEQDYADQVAADQEQFNKAVADGANPDEEGANLNAALDDLANERDKELGEIYEPVDFERVRHPELQIEGDGPYQVMAINYHLRGSIEVYDSFFLYAPWPGYVVVDRPYGWEYGVVYNPYRFHEVYLGWHEHYVVLGRPAFIGFYGHAGPVVFGIRGGYHFERRFGVRPAGFERSHYYGGGGRLGERHIGGPERGGGSRYGGGKAGERPVGGGSRYGGGSKPGETGGRPAGGGSRYGGSTTPAGGGSRYGGGTTPAGGGSRYGGGSTTPAGGTRTINPAAPAQGGSRYGGSTTAGGGSRYGGGTTKPGGSTSGYGKTGGSTTGGTRTGGSSSGYGRTGGSTATGGSRTGGSSSGYGKTGGSTPSSGGTTRTGGSSTTRPSSGSSTTRPSGGSTPPRPSSSGSAPKKKG